MMEAQKKENQIKRTLYFSAAAITGLVMLFLWIVTADQSADATMMLNICLLIMGLFCMVALMLFIYISDIFDEKGRLRRNELLSVFIMILCVMQFTYGFGCYCVNQLDFKNNSHKAAKEIYNETLAFVEESTQKLPLGAQAEKAAQTQALLTGQTIQNQLQELAGRYRHIGHVYLVDSSYTILQSDVAGVAGQFLAYDVLDGYRYPFSGGYLIAQISRDYSNELLRAVVLQLFTVLVTSIFFTIELVILATRLVEQNYLEIHLPEEERPYRVLGFVRQLAFLFYLSSSLSSTFVSILANQFSKALGGSASSFLSGLPQSAELLLTCSAIFLTAALVEKRGWKLPFGGGLGIVASGILLSAFADNIYIFILARAVVGLGYGFCWMTLRSLMLFAKNDGQKNEGFSLLNSGLYAGINCGAILGSILADSLGYTAVFCLGAGMTLITGLAIIHFENEPLALYRRRWCTGEAQEDSTAAEQKRSLAVLRNSPAPELIKILLYIILLVVPACILGSFVSYYMPIVMTDSLQKTTADIGRARLIYGLLIIYVGPFLARQIAKVGKGILWNLLYNGVFSLTLILLGILGGPMGLYGLMGATMLVGMADSFGFVAQNNYFLGLPLVRRLGETKALSWFSFIKKMAEMLGPITFGAMMSFGTYGGVALLGIVFAAMAGGFLVLNLGTVMKALSARKEGSALLMGEEM